MGIATEAAIAVVDLSLPRADLECALQAFRRERGSSFETTLFALRLRTKSSKDTVSGETTPRRAVSEGSASGEGCSGFDVLLWCRW